METVRADFQLFDREYFTFKQLKAQHSEKELEKIKKEYKEHWQKWKAIQMAVADGLPKEFHMEKPKIESWTNGWNLRNHFWCAYRDPAHHNQNACLAVLLNKKQFQVYLMFQHYKSEERSGSLAAYNDLLPTLAEWYLQVESKNYFIWPQTEHELDDHLPLTAFLEGKSQSDKWTDSMKGRSFQLGKLFFQTDALSNVVEETIHAMEDLAPLYAALDRTDR